MSSDTCVPAFLGWKRMESTLQEIPLRQRRSFQQHRYTIGSMMIWPSTNIKGAGTINGMRGFNSRVADRLDLTLECVRRHYRGEANPLSKVLTANSAYFDLFDSFCGFIEFFELQDLADPKTNDVHFMLPFDDFDRPGHPRDADEYNIYMQAARRFLDARNKRIDNLRVQV
nr:hypothetical protein [Gordonia phthalatica]